MTTRRLKRNKRWKLIKFTFFLGVFIGVFALIWLRTMVVNLEYELSQLGKQKMELMREERLVSAEKANFYSMKQIEETAIKQLGMNLPKREKIFFVKKITGAAPYRVSTKSVPRDSNPGLP
jgi:cell division protein FtsL